MSTIEPEVMEGGRRIDGNSIYKPVSNLTIEARLREIVDSFQHDLFLSSRWCKESSTYQSLVLC
jgi:hypothetical protein